MACGGQGHVETDVEEAMIASSSTSYMSVTSSHEVLEMNQEQHIGISGYALRSSSTGNGASQVSNLHHTTSGSVMASSSMNDASFEQPFQDVPDVTITNAKDLSIHTSRVSEVLTDKASNWKERIKALQEIRKYFCAWSETRDNVVQ